MYYVVLTGTHPYIVYREQFSFEVRVCMCVCVRMLILSEQELDGLSPYYLQEYNQAALEARATEQRLDSFPL